MREKCINIKAVCEEVVKMINHVISVEKQKKWKQLCRSTAWSINEVEEFA